MISKKYIIIGTAIFIALLAIGGFFYFIKENRNVTFKIDYPEGSAVISNTKDPDEKFASLKNGSSIWLSKKSYFIIFENDKLSKEPISIAVNDQTGTIDLDPVFSSGVLEDMLTSEQQAINTKIKQSVTSTQPYSLDNGSLYHWGEWYATQLHIYRVSSDDPDIGNPGDSDTYYLVLKKENSDWKVVAGPSLIITKPDNPTVPSYIIDAINPINAAF